MVTKTNLNDVILVACILKILYTLAYFSEFLYPNTYDEVKYGLQK